VGCGFLVPPWRDNWETTLECAAGTNRSILLPIKLTDNDSYVEVHETTRVVSEIRRMLPESAWRSGREAALPDGKRTNVRMWSRAWSVCRYCAFRLSIWVSPETVFNESSVHLHVPGFK